MNSEVSQEIKDLLHDHYKNLRRMLQAEVPRRGVQKSFEELVYSIVGKNSWRPTHVSPAAIREYVEGSSRNIQRAHGVYDGRLDRYQRTMLLLEGDERSFDDWWSFFIEHDKTVLITRAEHGSGRKFLEEDLVKLPSWNKGMFENSGFSVRLRKKTEGVWLKKCYDNMS
tara:strand:+ start:441 stop:947 length:507 start_codon:yes stop_codon:yes gene_type:complete